MKQIVYGPNGNEVSPVTQLNDNIVPVGYVLESSHPTAGTLQHGKVWFTSDEDMWACLRVWKSRNSVWTYRVIDPPAPPAPPRATTFRPVKVRP